MYKGHIHRNSRIYLSLYVYHIYRNKDFHNHKENAIHTLIIVTYGETFTNRVTAYTYFQDTESCHCLIRTLAYATLKERIAK
jgi:hypothetical protein